MQNLNYCRQILRADAVSDVAAVIIRAAAKFVLPDFGFLMADKELRGIETGVRARLPFPVIALEYACPGAGYDKSKRIVVAREIDSRIAVNCYAWFRSKMAWGSREEFSFDAHMPAAHMPIVGAPNDAESELCSLFGFLSALSCSNVAIRQEHGSNRSVKVKGALPFDDYHILTIGVPGSVQGSSSGVDNSHRSPREHLRRGHIRRYESGVKIWVNATVVNHGIGGKITKDYRLVPA